MFRALLAAALTAALLVPAARAHELGTHTGFVSAVSTLEPPIPGLLVRVIGGHDGLSLTNLTRKRVVIFDSRGEPIVVVAPGKTERWRDARVGAREEPPTDEGLVRNWRIAGTAGGERFEIVGFLGYRPPPGREADDSGTRAWVVALALVAAALVVGAAFVLPRIRRR